MLADDKTGNLGKLVAQLSVPLRLLLAALTPAKGESATTVAAKEKLAGVFNDMLGAQDGGKDDSRFEVELLAQRLDRVEAEQQIIAALDALRARFAGDACSTRARW